MITIKSNIEFLTNKSQWLKKFNYDLEMIANLDYAIETMRMIDQLKDDAWDESGRAFDMNVNNGEIL